jgi:hypothetical protein
MIMTWKVELDKGTAHYVSSCFCKWKRNRVRKILSAVKDEEYPLGKPKYCIQWPSTPSKEGWMVCGHGLTTIRTETCTECRLRKITTRSHRGVTENWERNYKKSGDLLARLIIRIKQKVFNNYMPSNRWFRTCRLSIPKICQSLQLKWCRRGERWVFISRNWMK